LLAAWMWHLALRACSTLQQPHCTHDGDHIARNTKRKSYNKATNIKNTNAFRKTRKAK